MLGISCHVPFSTSNTPTESRTTPASSTPPATRTRPGDSAAQECLARDSDTTPPSSEGDEEELVVHLCDVTLKTSTLAEVEPGTSSGTGKKGENVCI